MNFETVLLPLLLSLGAGLATGIGSLLSLTIKKVRRRFLAFSLGFSAGVMIYVSFIELLAPAIRAVGILPAHVAFFAGMVLFMLIDHTVPHSYITERFFCDKDNKMILSAGVLTAIGIAIHNLPEGLAVVATSIKDLSVGIPLAFAVALHNIPEGIAVAMPIYFVTKSRRLSFGLSVLSGLTEPLGALIGVILLSPFLNQYTLSLLLAFVAGVMILISFDELLPICFEHCRGKFAVIGIILGMLVMTTSLYLFR